MSESEMPRSAPRPRVGVTPAQTPTGAPILPEIREPIRQGEAATGVAPVPAPEAAARPLTPEEKEFMDALTRLFTTAQEFGLSLASMETDISNLPGDVKEVVEQGREVAKAVKSFQRIIRKRLGTV